MVYVDKKLLKDVKELVAVKLALEVVSSVDVVFILDLVWWISFAQILFKEHKSHKAQKYLKLNKPHPMILDTINALILHSHERIGK